jgi:hypothetical protein
MDGSYEEIPGEKGGNDWNEAWLGLFRQSGEILPTAELLQQNH